MTGILCIIVLLSLGLSSKLASAHSYANESLDPKILGLKGETLTHFHLYWHDTVSGSKPSSVSVLASKNAATMFGGVNMFDNPLTASPELNSQVVGRSQGFYGGAAQDQIGLLMAMNFVFTDGKYKGSSIAVLGRNTIFEAVREMAVVGGSGRFRFSRGYAEAKTHSLNPATLDAIVEYNVYVLHY